MSRLFGILLLSTLVSPALAENASPALRAEFDTFFGAFRTALKANDSGVVASMTKLPFMNERDYADAAKFRAKAYPEFFTAKVRACFQKSKAHYDRDGEKNDTYSVNCDDNIYTFTKTSAGFLFTDVGPAD
jgi:hypothetical protein